MKYKAGDLVEVDPTKINAGWRHRLIGNHNIVKIGEVHERYYSIDEGPLYGMQLHEDQIIGPGALFGDEVMVKNRRGDYWEKRLIVCIDHNGSIPPYLCATRGQTPCEIHTFAVSRWEYMKPIPKTPTVEITCKINGEDATKDEALKVLNEQSS